MLVVGARCCLWVVSGVPRQTKCSHDAVRLALCKKRARGSSRTSWLLAEVLVVRANVSMSLLAEIELKSLILAQIERWRHALHMQVERQRGGNPGGERRTGEEYIGTCPGVGDNAAKAALIPHML